LAILIAVVLFIYGKGKRKKEFGLTKWPYYPKKPLSVPEQVMYFRLIKALPEHIVLAQVALSRILGVEKGQNFGEWFNRINRMSADFVICEKDASVIAVIEIDDASHQKADRQVADAKKEKALGSAGIRIVRWQSRDIPDEATIKATFSIGRQEALALSQPNSTSQHRR